jgi:glyoxylase-like metal-dependent hydrolase (beta-lactamase superfamily II)
MLKAQQGLTNRLTLVSVGGANVLSFSANEGRVLVDSGAYDSEHALVIPNVRILFNTHYHLDQTGNNALFATAGAKIVAHERTRQWMATDHWVPAEDRYEKARPKAALPSDTFLTTASLKVGDERIDYGYLLLAHTSGDIYVHFKNSNVLAVGDVASPLRDPALDYFTGAWIGGRVDAMDLVLKLSNDQTRIVPACGPVMTRAEFKAERDMMEEVRARLFKEVREGKGPKEMLEEGLLNGLVRRWEDPHKFLYDAAKGLWAHHDKLDPNVV